MKESSSNPNFKNITTPTVEGGKDQHDTAAQTISPTKERATGFRGLIETTPGKLLAGGAGVLALGALAFGGFKVAEAAYVPVSHEPVPTAPANPGQTTDPTPEATPSATATPEVPVLPDRYNYGITDAQVAPLQAEDLAVLNTSPLKEKGVLAMYHAQDLPKFSKDWESVSHNPLDLVPAEINANNTPDEINSIIMNSHRQALTLTQTDGFHFDKIAADKLIVASLINGSLSQAYGSLTDLTKQLSTETGRAATARTFAASNYFSLPKINTHSEKYTDAAGYTCMNLNTTQVLNSGASVTSDLTACLLTINNNSLWVQR